jgi:hypothetical protein
MVRRVISREQLMAKLNKAYPENDFHMSEDRYDGSEGMIYCGEDVPTDRKGYPLYNYWAENYEYYDLGVANHFINFLLRNGWYFEWINSAEGFIIRI